MDGGQDPLPEEPQLVEEEFDLSDIMGEQLEAQTGTKEDRLRQMEEQVFSFPFLSFPFLSFPFLSFPFPLAACYIYGICFSLSSSSSSGQGHLELPMCMT